MKRIKLLGLNYDHTCVIKFSIMQFLKLFKKNLWKIKAKKRSTEIKSLKKRVKEITQSRDNIKKKNQELRTEKDQLKKDVFYLEKELKKN